MNTNCLAPVVLDFLRKACDLESSLTAKEYLDLASETGEIIDLAGKGKEYAKRFLDTRGCYLLIKVIAGGSVVSGT